MFGVSITFPFGFDDALYSLAVLYVVRRKLCGGFQDAIDRCLSSRFHPLTALLPSHILWARNTKRERSRLVLYVRKATFV